MIINISNKMKIKILIDEADLKNAGIQPEKFISNSNQTLSYLQNLLKYNTNWEELVLKDYYIFTYNYKVFSLILLL